MKHILMLLAATVIPATANATVYTVAYHFSATNFTGGTPTVDPVVGDFSVTFDDSVAANSKALNLFDINESYTGTVTYSYNPSNYVLIIGNDATPTGCGYGAGAYLCLILTAPQYSSPPGGLLLETGGAQTSHITFTPLQTAAVPEPSTWAMLISGFGLIGGALRRRNYTVAQAV